MKTVGNSGGTFRLKPCSQISVPTLMVTEGAFVEKVEIILRRSKQGEVEETVLAAFDITQNSAKIKEDTILSFSGLDIHIREHSVYRDGVLIPLTHKEFSTLVYLARHPQWVFSAEQIYSAIWETDGEDCGTSVSSIIGHIRRKLTPETPKGGYILTVIGGGYKFDVSQFENSP